MDFVTKSSEIPEARFYVLATDTFMSGWGHAENRANVLIIPCSDLRTAEDVAAVLRGRDEMQRVRINSKRPRVNPYWAAQVKSAAEVRGWTGADLPCQWITDGAVWEAVIDEETVHRTRLKVTPEGFVTCVYEIGWAAGITEPSGGLAFTARDLEETLLKWRASGHAIRILWPDGSPRETIEPIGSVAS